MISGISCVMLMVLAMYALKAGELKVRILCYEVYSITATMLLYIYSGFPQNIYPILRIVLIIEGDLGSSWSFLRKRAI